MARKGAFAAALVGGLVLVAASAWADAYADLQRAKAVFDGASSWHATEQMSSGQTILIDHVAPDSWRIQLQPTVVEIIIGSDAYMVANGRSIRMPRTMPQIEQMVNRNWLEIDPEVRSTLRDLGMQSFGGRVLHEYTYRADGNPVELYLHSDYLPAASVVQTANGTVTIRYSGYNTPITITP